MVVLSWSFVASQGMSRRAIFGVVAQQLQRAILRGELPADLPAERDLALLFHVSRPTIRKALQILRAQAPDPQAGTVRSAEVPILAYIGETGTHFYQDLFIALAQCAQEQGFRITSASTDGSSNLLAAERAALNGAAAIICMTERVAAILGQVIGVPSVPQVPQVPLVPQVPIVVVGLLRTEVDAPVRCVWGDRRAAAVIAVNHAVAAGHRKMVCVIDQSSALDGPTPVAPTLVELGFRSALQANGLTPCMNVQLSSGLELPDLIKQGCTAIICDMDFTATRVYAQAQACGLVIPRDLSVIGIGDTPWSRSLRPALTTVDFRPREIAAYAVAACRMGKPPHSESILVEPRLIPRESVIGKAAL